MKKILVIFLATMTVVSGLMLTVPASCAPSPRSIPPPLARSSEPPTSYYAGWYAGGVYSGSSGHAQLIQMSIVIPYADPNANEFYYVLLSAWDSAGSYDQLGFSNTWGTWGLTYSWTSGNPNDPNNYHYSSNAMNLAKGAWYTFIMTIQSGVVTFRAYQGFYHPVLVWSLTANTGGQYFVVSSFYSGWGSTYYGYTDYEEVWYTAVSGACPAGNFNFYFMYNIWKSTSGSVYHPSFSVFRSGSVPSSLVVTIGWLYGGRTVLVQNR